MCRAGTECIVCLESKAFAGGVKAKGAVLGTGALLLMLFSTSVAQAQDTGSRSACSSSSAAGAAVNGRNGGCGRTRERACHFAPISRGRS
jgi:hypothetical protein